MKPKNEVQLSEHSVNNEINYASDAFMAWHLSNAFDMKKFKEEFKIIKRDEQNVFPLSSVVFDVVGIDPPIANALRRIMISKVPTMALEQITIYQNTSEIPDEILAHRLGLIPLRAPPNQFESVRFDGQNTAEGAFFDEKNSLKFELDITCSNNDKDSRKVMSKDLRWMPILNQSEKFREADVGPVHDDILIAELVPGQQIKFSAIAIMGRGEVHAKWSPVATAFYRMLPVVEITKPIKGKDAKRLKEVCPLGVFDIEDSVGVVVNGGRSCTVCRECIREQHFPDSVKLSRKKDHFVFSIESTGAYRAKDIFREAINEFKRTLVNVQKNLQEKQDKLENQ